MKIRLSNVGYIQQPPLAAPDSVPVELSIPNELEVPVLIVYEGDFESMGGPVTITEQHLMDIERNHNRRLNKIKATMGFGLELRMLPAKYKPPLQVDHTTSAWDTVGRLVGEVYLGHHTLENGDTRRALFGTMRFLGRDNVERVLDGRWTHVSIGADLEEAKIDELTVTPFPAAKEASMLSDSVSNLSKGDNMLKKLKARLMAKFKLSEKEADEKLSKMSEEEKTAMSSEADKEEKEKLAAKKLADDEHAEKLKKMKKRLMDDEKLSEEEADTKMSKMSDDEKKELSAKCSKDEEDAKLAAEEDEKQRLAAEKEEEDKAGGKAQMAAARKEKRAKLTALVGDFRKTSSSTSIELKKVQFSARLNSLRATGKITPAEVKKMDLAKLAKMSDEATKAVFESYEQREPVIVPGVVGSIKSINLSEIQANSAKAQLEADSRRNMSLKKGTDKPNQEAIRDNEQTIRMASFAKDPVGYDQIAELIDKDEKELAKVALKAALAQGGNAGADVQGHETQLKTLAESYAKLMGQFEELCKLV